MTAVIEQTLWEVGSKALKAYYQYLEEQYGDTSRVIKVLALIDLHNDLQPKGH